MFSAINFTVQYAAQVFPMKFLKQIVNSYLISSFISCGNARIIDWITSNISLYLSACSATQAIKMSSFKDIINEISLKIQKHKILKLFMDFTSFLASKTPRAEKWIFEVKLGGFSKVELLINVLDRPLKF